jgi:lysozyme family protein
MCSDSDVGVGRAGFVSCAPSTHCSFTLFDKILNEGEVRTEMWLQTACVPQPTAASS